MLTQLAVDNPAAPVKSACLTAVSDAVCLCVWREESCAPGPSSDDRRRVSVDRHASQLFV